MRPRLRCPSAGPARSRNAPSRPGRSARAARCASRGRRRRSAISLFASARVRPVSSAASVGPSPTDPVMPFSTTSASTERTSCSASSAPSAVSVDAELPGLLGERGRRWCRPRDRRRRTGRGSPRMTSRACVPIDPVEPRITTLRTGPMLLALVRGLHDVDDEHHGVGALDVAACPSCRSRRPAG